MCSWMGTKQRSHYFCKMQTAQKVMYKLNMFLLYPITILACKFTIITKIIVRDGSVLTFHKNVFPYDFEYLLYMFPGIRSKRPEGVETTNMVAQEERTILKEVNTMPTTFCSIFLGLIKSTFFFLLLNACSCKLVWNYHQQQRMVFLKLSSFFLIIHYRQRHSSFFSAISLIFFSFPHSPFFYPFMLIIVDDSRPFFSHPWLTGLFVSLSHRKRHRRGAWSSPTVVSFSLWVYHWQLHLPLTTCIFFKQIPS